MIFAIILKRFKFRFLRNCSLNSTSASKSAEKSEFSDFSILFSLQKVVNTLESFYRTQIRPGRTLVILDEIQSSERALMSRKRYAYDYLPQKQYFCRLYWTVLLTAADALQKHKIG